MLFRQFFDSVSCTYTYLLAPGDGGEALIIDPVLEKVDRYIQLLNELDLRLVKAVDTHLHAVNNVCWRTANFPRRTGNFLTETVTAAGG